jgi:hypothetical protein
MLTLARPALTFLERRQRHGWVLEAYKLGWPAAEAKRLAFTRWRYRQQGTLAQRVIPLPPRETTQGEQDR